MEFLTLLWLPILLSAVFVFIASSILHMVIPLHKADYRKLPDEDGLVVKMREQRLTHGDYYFPYCSSMKEMGLPEMIEKHKTGPAGFVSIMPPGSQNMGKNLFIWFLYSVLIGLVTAYVGFYALGRGADYLAVFRITGAVSMLAYATSHIPNSIWKGATWSSTGKFIFDGIIYGLLTAGTFGWLWPEASA